MSIKEIYNTNKNTPSDFNEHMETLKSLCDGLDTVVEFGSRNGVSTSAIANSTCKTFHTYDIKIKPQILILKDEHKKDMVVHEVDVLKAAVPKCDLLFINTLHTYKQLSQELSLHGNKSSKYIVFHDTVTFGWSDEVETDSKKKGLLSAIYEFLRNNHHWKTFSHNKNNNGLLILIRDKEESSGI